MSHASVSAGLIIAAALCIAGCATVATTSPQITAATPATAKVDLAAMTTRLADRDRALTSMQTAAIMEYAAPGHHAKARENLTVSRPSSLRVEAMSPFGVALIVAAHGPDLEIFDPSKNRLIHTAANAETLDRFVQIPMAPSDAVTLLLGIAPDSEALAAEPPYSTTDEPAGENAGTAMTVGAWRIGGGSICQLGFEDGNLAMVRRIGVDGRVQYEVRYSEYHDIGGVMFPYVVDAKFPVAGSHLVLHYERPLVNVEPKPSLFELSAVGAK